MCNENVSKLDNEELVRHIFEYVQQTKPILSSVVEPPLDNKIT